MSHDQLYTTDEITKGGHKKNKEEEGIHHDADDGWAQSLVSGVYNDITHAMLPSRPPFVWSCFYNAKLLPTYYR